MYNKNRSITAATACLLVCLQASKLCALVCWLRITRARGRFLSSPPPLHQELKPLAKLSPTNAKQNRKAPKGRRRRKSKRKKERRKSRSSKQRKGA